MSDIRREYPASRGRPCATCAHHERMAIEQEISAGTPLRTISATFNVARSSIRRHLTNHIEVDEATSARLGLDPETLAVRVYEVAERARDIAAEALDVGTLTVALRAGDAELRALAALAALGVRDERRPVEYDAFKVTTHAVIRAARRDRTVAEAVSEQLDLVDRQEIAADIRALFDDKAIVAPIAGC